MKVIGKDRTSCDVCNPIDEILARLDALERRASAIVAKVQGIAPDGEGNVTLPTSSSDTDPLHGRIDAFAMSSEVKEAADDAHAYATSIADDVIVINSEIDALNQAVAALQPAEIEAIKVAVETLQTTVATLESTVATLNNSVAGKVSKSGDTMTGNLTISKKTPVIYLNNTSIDSLATCTGYENITEQKFTDKNNVQMVGIRLDRDVTYTRYFIQISDNIGGKTKNARFDFSMSSDGASGLYLPSSPISSENSKKVATTEWVNTASSVVHTTGNERISGIKTFDSSPVVPSTPSNATGTEIATANWVLTKINELATKNNLT